MQRCLDITVDRLHHAYLIEGEREETLAMLLFSLERAGIALRGNPDLICEAYDVFYVEHARMLRHRERYRSVHGEKKIFIITFNMMMPEAQHALLKTLEEPSPQTHFFFVTRTIDALLPTVRSRMCVIRSITGIQKQKIGDSSAQQFLVGTLSERLRMIEPWLKVKEEQKSHVKEEVRVFLDELEHALRGGAEGDLANVTPMLLEVLRAKTYLADRAPSLKLILEHLALTLPKRERSALEKGTSGPDVISFTSSGM